MVEPTENRIPKKGGGTRSIRSKMLLERHKDPEPDDLRRELYKTIVINGVEYCRMHLLIRCHFCEVDFRGSRDAVEEERERLGLRQGGDAHVDRFSEKWVNEVEGKTLQMTLEDDVTRLQYGQDYYAKNPHRWNERIKQLSEDERKLNDSLLRELAELKGKGAGSCCYWACKNPSSADRLLTCAGCKFHKYCCREHQALDWKWEHRAECSANVPKVLLDEMEATLAKQLAGDYRT